mmetsp:Transcript_8967/g.19182  ORF Transcript_8967/g.19182 Transcript_8967/m.19182 type:complete len:219 (+) Transcript_8967:396-1052(+)
MTYAPHSSSVTDSSSQLHPEVLAQAEVMFLHLALSCLHLLGLPQLLRCPGAHALEQLDGARVAVPHRTVQGGHAVAQLVHIHLALLEEHLDGLGVPLLSPPARPVDRRVAVPVPITGVQPRIQEQPGNSMATLESSAMHGRVSVLLPDAQIHLAPVLVQKQFDNVRAARQCRCHDGCLAPLAALIEVSSISYGLAHPLYIVSACRTIQGPERLLLAVC